MESVLGTGLPYCLLAQPQAPGIPGAGPGGGLPDLLDQHLQRAGRRDGQQGRDETADLASDWA